MWREIKNIISQKKRFLLTTHVNPDGDGIGSACALIELLRSLGKQTLFVCDSPIPSKLTFLDYHNKMSVYDRNRDYSDTEVVILLDAHKKDRVGRLKELIDQPHVITLCIDHHCLSETFTPYTVIDWKACSVGAMIYELFQEFGISINQKAAAGIYTSILCDTGRFSYSSTSSLAHKIAEECIQIGVDPDLMYSRLFQHITLNQMKVFGSALQRMETFYDNRVVIQQIFLEDWAKTGGEVLDLEHVDLDYIHDFNKSIEDVECMALLRELPGNFVRISIRSHSDLNIGELIGQLGGGGHSKAAGVTWEGTVTEAKETLLHILGKALRPESCKI